jgi:hypothetical protein
MQEYMSNMTFPCVNGIDGSLTMFNYQKEEKRGGGGGLLICSLYMLNRFSQHIRSMHCQKIWCLFALFC